MGCPEQFIMQARFDQHVVLDEVWQALARQGTESVPFPEVDSLEGLNPDQALKVVGQLGHAYLAQLMDLLWEVQGHLPTDLEQRIAIRAAYVDAAWRQDMRTLRGKFPPESVS